MNDEETVALIAGGHTLGKCHGAANPSKHVGPEPEGASIEEQGLGWKNAFGKGNAEDTITSGLEGAWTSTPVQWSHDYFNNLFNYEWELVKSPAGAWQWTPKDESAAGDRSRCPRPGEVPRAHDAHDGPLAEGGPDLRADLEALPREPGGVRGGLRQGLVQADAPRHGAPLAAARPGGPRAAAVAGPRARRRPRADRGRRTSPPSSARSSPPGCPSPQLVSTAWASAATFRDTDKRGGANGARIRLAPQKDWEVNQPAELAKVLQTLEGIQQEFNGAQSGGKKISLADLIVLGGCAAVEEAAKRAGHEVQVPFAPGRTDATQEMTDVESFAVLEPTADGFRNYLGKGHDRPAPELLVDRAHLLTLTAPEMTVLVGGMRVLNANFGQSKLGVFTERPGDADQRLLRQPARHGHGVEEVEGRRARLRRTRPQDGRGQVDRQPPSISCSARTRSFAPSRRSTRAATRSRSSSTTSWRPGTR